MEDIRQALAGMCRAILMFSLSSSFLYILMFFCRTSQEIRHSMGFLLRNKTGQSPREQADDVPGTT